MGAASWLKRKLRFPVLCTAKYVGLFHLSRALTGRALRILCYHGSSLEDEHEFSPGTFMRRETFRQRMRHLLDRGYPVLPLGEAVDRLTAGTLPRRATVITIDDGWIGTYRNMVPVLAECRFPATLYVATYYMEKETQVFNMLVQYLLWKARGRELDLGSLLGEGERIMRLLDPQAAAQAALRLTTHGESHLDAEERQELCRKLAKELGYDLARAEQARLFRFFDATEAAKTLRSGVELQLHTHRHRFPQDERAVAEKELEDNRRSLDAVSRARREHFCYPSGEYGAHQLAWLKGAGVRTATTTKSGFNYPVTPLLELRRFLDSEKIAEIEFEAEMSGLFELLRRIGLNV